MRNDRLWPSGPKPIDCVGCPLAGKRGLFVPGMGDLQGPVILAVFERPGNHESGDCRCEPGKHPVGDPLVGPTGKIVESSLGGWDGVYRTNVRKCNDEPDSEPDRVNAILHCTKAYLQKELDLLTSLGTVKVTLLGGLEAAERFRGDTVMAKSQGEVLTREEIEAIYAAT